jgi:hypothetical protein
MKKTYDYILINRFYEILFILYIFNNIYNTFYIINTENHIQ